MRKCSVEGCHRRHSGRGFCEMHLKRIRKYGDPNIVLRPVSNAPLLERLADRIEVESPGCWVWTGFLMANGYGTFTAKESSGTQLAHRLVWEELVGRIPEGLTLDHLCRVRRCVNPDHLEPVTFIVNVRRSGAITTKLGRRGGPPRKRAAA